MEAIILSAGRGSRLLPLTTDIPKCLLPIGMTTVLGLQLDTLLKLGVENVTVVTGFNAHMVEVELNRRETGPKVKTLFNPFYQVADNLASCWMVRSHMEDDFLLINGDTLFSPRLLEMVLDAPTQNISVTIDQKSRYDGDDMKVSLDGTRLSAIGKTLTREQTDGESIGILRFMDEGSAIFRRKLEMMMHEEAGTRNWYLSAIHELARQGTEIQTINIKGSSWAELDTQEDYEICRSLFGGHEMARKRFAIV